MGYYIRVLGESNPSISLYELRTSIEEKGLKASIEVEEGGNDAWEQLLVKDKNGREIILIEKNEVIDGELGQDEIEEFKDEVMEFRPASAANWLLTYLDRVKIIYAFQILNAVDNEENWNIVGELKSKIWGKTKGILQADHEGFSNEDGYHILWQFSDDVTGSWHMAVIDSDGNWVKFKMDLGDRKQRKEFLEGKVPKGAEVIL